jgi:outer membrane immunogenic protein
MKHTLAHFAATVAFILLPFTAFAADVVDEIPAAPEAPMEQAVAPSGWAGAYAGASVGYGWGKNRNAASSFSTKGFNGGVFGGYNLQNGQIVYGGEGDLGYSAAKGSTAGASGKEGFNGALRARVGYDMDPVLLYAAGGVAASKGKLTVGALSDTQTHVGWTAGVGADAKITDNMFGRVEFRHNDFGTQNYAIGAGTKAKLTDNEMRLGVGVKF